MTRKVVTSDGRELSGRRAARSGCSCCRIGGCRHVRSHHRSRNGLSTILVEKSEYWGGSSSRSGGGVWIPGNSILRREAPTDDIDSARTYLKSIVGEDADATESTRISIGVRKPSIS